MKTVPEMLRDAASIYEERNKLYGNNYKKFGWVMNSMFEGIFFQAEPTPDDWNRIGVIVQMVGKITRYVENFNRGGHKDSLDDLAVYTMMLQELDNEINVRKVEKERGR